MRAACCLLVLLLAACSGAATDAPTPAPTPPVASEPVPPSPPAMPTHEVATFTSAALGVDKRVNVLLPPGYQTSPDVTYPVVYMLHGLGGDEDNWMKLGIAKAASEVGLDAILVMPDGDDGFYVNWQSKPDYDKCLAGKRPFGRASNMKTYCVKDARYSDYIVNDLVAFIEGKYRTIATREARAIGGLSMGGYGALVTAFRHTDKFGAVASHAGVASLRYVGPDPYVKGGEQLFDDPKPVLKRPPFGPHFGAIFGADIADWKARDPAVLAGKLTNGQLAIYLDAGTKDMFRLHNGAGHLSDVLKAGGIEHQWHLIEGGRHDAAFWTDRIDDSLRFFEAFFRQK